MLSYCSRPPQEAPRSPQDGFKRLSWRFSRLPGPPKTAQDGQNPSEKCVSRVLALLESVLKIFCFARSILIAPGLFQERPMTVPRGLKQDRSRKLQDCPKILPRGFLSASAALQGRLRPSKTAPRGFKTVPGRLKMISRLPQHAFLLLKTASGSPKITLRSLQEAFLAL